MDGHLCRDSVNDTGHHDSIQSGGHATGLASGPRQWQSLTVFASQQFEVQRYPVRIGADKLPVDTVPLVNGKGGRCSCPDGALNHASRAAMKHGNRHAERGTEPTGNESGTR